MYEAGGLYGGFASNLYNVSNILLSFVSVLTCLHVPDIEKVIHHHAS